MYRRSMFAMVPALVAAVRPDLMSGGTAGSEQPSRRPGPAFDVNTVDGTVIKVHQQKGKVILLDFMTTGCPTCKVASASLEKLYRELAARKFCPIAVALDVETAPLLARYRQQYGLTFPLGTAPRDRVVAYLQHSPLRPLLVPTLVFLDRRGSIVATEVGWRGEDNVRASLLKLLSE